MVKKYETHKFDAPFEKLKNFDNNGPDVALRKAIILQAILDATNEGDKTYSARKAAKEAKAWIFDNGKYFKEICYEAGVAPESVINITKYAVNFSSYAKKLHKFNNRARKKVNLSSNTLHKV